MNKNQKIENWAQKEILRNLDHMILDQGGRLFLFGRYLVESTQSGTGVWRNDDFLAEFTSKRSALSYCVADRQRDYNLARRILQLDTTKRILGDDISMRKSLLTRSTNTRTRDTVAAKLQQKDSNLRSVISQLEKCISRAKYLQLRGFINETARTRRA